MSIKLRARGRNFKKLMRIRDQQIKRADKATVKALDRFGAIIRQDSKRAIGSYAKTKKMGYETVDGRRVFVVTPASKPRSPGQPPRSRTSHEFYSLRNIRYLSDYEKARVRIGPWNTGGEMYGTKTVPDLQEFGGTINTKVKFVPAALTRQDIKTQRVAIDPATGKRMRGPDGRFIRMTKEQKTQVSSRVTMIESKDGRPMSIRIPKRPFMRPSFQKHKRKATQIWRDYYRAQKGNRR